MKPRYTLTFYRSTRAATLYHLRPGIHVKVER